MTKAKVDAKYSQEDIQLMYRACCLHGSLENSFGLFCIGAGLSLRSIFKFLQDDNPFKLINMEVQQMAVATLTLLDGFDDTKADFGRALAEGISNEEMSNKIMVIVEEARRLQKEKEGKGV